jgi:hypothetical protein
MALKHFSGLFFLVTTLTACSEEEVVEDCDCIKTNYVAGFRTASSNSYFRNIVSTEKVPCQDQEMQVVTQMGKGQVAERYYVICCANLNNLPQCDL